MNCIVNYKYKLLRLYISKFCTLIIIEYDNFNNYTYCILTIYNKEII